MGKMIRNSSRKLERLHRVINRLHHFVPVIVLMCLAAAQGYYEIPSIAYHIPRISGITVDGEADDWGVRGFKADLFTDQFGEAIPAEDARGFLRLAWDDTRLLIFLEVTDDAGYEDPHLDYLWRADCVELFLADDRGSSNRVQFIISPGRSADQPEMRIRKYDKRHAMEESLPELQISAASGIKPDGYSLEAAIPFSNLLLIPELGKELAFQIYLRDSDRSEDPEHNLLPWYNVTGSHENSFALHSIRLSFTADRRQNVSVRPVIVDDKTIEIAVGTLNLENEVRLEFKHGGKLMTRFTFEPGVSLPFNKYTGSLKQYKSLFDPLVVFLNDVPYMIFEMDALPRYYINMDPYPFETEIRKYEYLDLRFPPEPGKILFVGSSSIRMWDELETDMQPLNVLNRGFGGSTAEHLLHFLDRIIVPYQPSKIVIYEGDNDIVGGTLPDDFLKNCEEIVSEIQRSLPETPVYFLSVKPSPQRYSYWPQMQEANRLLSALADKNANVHYIHLADEMHDDQNRLRNDLFLPDGVHLNRSGYAIWTRVIQARLMAH